MLLARMSSSFFFSFRSSHISICMCSCLKSLNKKIDKIELRTKKSLVIDHVKIETFSSYFCRKLSEANRKLREKLSAMYSREREWQSQLSWSKSLLDSILDNEIGSRPGKFPSFLCARNVKEFKSIDCDLMSNENADYFVSLSMMKDRLTWTCTHQSHFYLISQKSLLEIANKKCKSCNEFIKRGLDLIIAADFSDRSRLKNYFPISSFHAIFIGENIQ